MAERRMFVKTIIDSDAFLDMPQSAQNLYFHLSMRADDDGFINNPKKIARMLGCSEDDMKILLMKGFIYVFDSGVIVIKHWRMHNLIRNDRYKGTAYKEELSKLKIKENGSYTLLKGDDNDLLLSNDNQMTTKRQPNGNQMETQVRLGKDSIGKVNKDDVVDNDTKPQKSVYGKFKSVRLTDEEYKEIKAAKLEHYIDRLDLYKASKGKRYKNDYATIMSWVKRDGEGKRNEPVPDYENEAKQMTPEETEALKARLQKLGGKKVD